MRSIMRNFRSLTNKNFKVAHQLPQPVMAKYLLVVSDRGMTSEVNHFTSFKEAKRAFGKIARDHGYKPSEINASDKYDVSIWEWKENKYENIYYYP
jgi:hypothetical protein